jgi:DNA polymerase-3 subunit chi
MLLCQWVEHFYESGRTAQVLVDSTLAAQHLDQMLWTFSQPSFIPHRILSSADAIPVDEPVIISIGEVVMPEREALVCDALAGLEFLGRYGVVLHFVIQDEPEGLQASRLLWQQVRDLGLGAQHVPYAFNHPRFGWPPRDGAAASHRPHGIQRAGGQ